MASEAMKQMKQFILEQKASTNMDGLNEKLYAADAQAMVTYEEEDCNAIPIAITTPKELKTEDIVFYIHGGAMMSGDRTVSKLFMNVLAKEIGARVISITYRLAPQFPYPAQVNDCFAAYEGLLAKYPGSKIALVGDSAGATLVVTTALKAMEAGVQLPTSVTAYSPITDFATGLPSRVTNVERDILLPADSDGFLRQFYFPGLDPKDKYLSPIFADYEGFPPLKLVVSRDETIYHDSVILAWKAKGAGVKVDYQEWDDCFHAFPGISFQTTPEGKQVIDETIEFMKKCFSREETVSEKKAATSDIMKKTVGEFLENEKAKQILSEKLGPMFINNPMIDQMKNISFEKIMSMGGPKLPQDVIEALEKAFQ